MSAIIAIKSLTLLHPPMLWRVAWASRLTAGGTQRHPGAISLINFRLTRNVTQVLRSKKTSFKRGRVTAAADPGAGAGHLILPKGFEPLRTELGVSHGVRDVPMPEILLNRPRVVPLVRQLVARRMTEHVRMNGEGEFRELAGARDELPGRRRRHGSAALRDEQIR
jgi:hypothetical protein